MWGVYWGGAGGRGNTVCIWFVCGVLWASRGVCVCVCYACCARCDVYADGCNNDAMMIAMLGLMTMPMMLRTRPMTMTMMMLMTMVMLTMALRTLFGRLGAVVNLDWAV